MRILRASDSSQKSLTQTQPRTSQPCTGIVVSHVLACLYLVAGHTRNGDGYDWVRLQLGHILDASTECRNLRWPWLACQARAATRTRCRAYRTTTSNRNSTPVASPAALSSSGTLAGPIPRLRRRRAMITDCSWHSFASTCDSALVSSLVSRSHASFLLALCRYRSLFLQPLKYRHRLRVLVH